MTESEHGKFLARTLTVVGVALAAIVLSLLVWIGVQTLLLAFAGVLVGVLLRGCAEGVTRYTRLPHGVSLATVGVLIVLMIGGLFWTAGEMIASQVADVLKQVPRSAEKLEAYAARQPLIRKAFDLQEPSGQEPSGQDASAPTTQSATSPSVEEPIKAAVADQEILKSPGAAEVPSNGDNSSSTRPSSGSPIVARVVQAGGGSVALTATRAVAAIVNGALNIIVVAIVAVYVAASPRAYVSGFLRVVPLKGRRRAAEVLDALGRTLWFWLKGQGVTMTVIGTATGLGLWIIGIEQWLVLGLLTGLFNFIPNLGPFISYVPAMLIALSVSTDKAIAVTILYLIAQSVEGYILTPLVQRKAVDIPPALLIVAQVLSGVFGGALGVMLAAPLTAVILVIVRMVYVRDILGDDLDRPIPEATIGKISKDD